MRKILSILFLSVLVVQVNAQCRFEKWDCKGECRRFVDKDGDGFCDLGLLTATLAEVDADLPKLDPPELDLPELDMSELALPEAVEPDIQMSEEPSCTAECKLALDVSPDYTLISDTMFAKPATAEVDEPQNQQAPTKSYDLLLLTLLTLGLYALSVLLVACKSITKATHRKLWNWVLLITFLVSGILGLVLVLQIDYDLDPSLFRDFLFLHVEFGIVMTIVSLIHVCWHVNYYLNMFAKNKKS